MNDYPISSFKNGHGVCKTCPTGYIWSANDLECQWCPKGTMTEGYGLPDCRRCIFPNVVTPNVGSFLCRLGYFKDFSGSYDCVACPAGTKMEKELHEDYQCHLDCENFPA